MASVRSLPAAMPSATASSAAVISEATPPRANVRWMTNAATAGSVAASVQGSTGSRK